MLKRSSILKALQILLSAAGRPLQATPAFGEEEKFVLCRPRGGLNDTLCQIERCREYAERHSRTLLIDSTRSGLLGEFSEFFQLRDETARVHLDLTDTQLKFLNTLSCYPHALRGKLDAYQPVYSSEARNFLDKNTGIRPSFDFKKDYEEAVLVHEQCGGGKKSFALLDRIALAESLRPIVLSRIQALGEGYIAIHVRNTDYKTEYETFFRTLYPRVTNRSLLVCSDDAAVIAHARAFFDKSKIMTSSRAEYSGNRPPHNWHKKRGSKRQRKAITTNAIVDLIALGRAKKLYFANVMGDFPSGYSRLAEYLCRHKRVIDALLGIKKSRLTLK